MEFSWMSNKRALNLKKHKLDFQDAEEVFRGPTLTIEDSREAT
jgi:uncharacterized DUF497 family protein